MFGLRTIAKDASRRSKQLLGQRHPLTFSSFSSVLLLRICASHSMRRNKFSLVKNVHVTDLAELKKFYMVAAQMTAYI